MKTMKTMIMALIAISMITVQSCKSDDDGGDSGNAGSGTVTANVDGESYQSDALGTSATIVNAGGGMTLLITSNEFSSSRNITLSISSGFDGEGTYPIGGDNSVFVIGQYIEANASNPTATQIWAAPFDESQQGEINITSFTDTTIEGTFSFTGRNEDQSTRTISNGSFNLEY